MAILSGPMSRRGNSAWTLPVSLNCGDWMGNLRDVDVAQGEGADPLEGAGRGIEAEGRLAELEPAAVKLQAEGLDGQGVDAGAHGDVHGLQGQEGVLELADAEVSLFGERRFGGGGAPAGPDS